MSEELNKLIEVLHKHHEKTVISCEETCFCWDVEALICEIEQAEAESEA